METVDHYDVLGVTRGAETEVITAAYRALSKRLHPDREGGDAQRFALVNAAHDTLRDPSRRAEYDLTLTDAPGQPDTAPADDADDEPDDDWGEVFVDDFDEYAEVIEPVFDPTSDKPPTTPARRRPGWVTFAVVVVFVTAAVVLTALVGSTPGWLWLTVLFGTSALVTVTRASASSLVTAAILVALAWTVRDQTSTLAVVATYATWALPVVALIAVVATSPREE